MSKKRVSGAWVDDTPHIYNTSTDTFSTLPHEVIGDGTALSAWNMKGNMTQSGTPTPSNPIYPTECGEKTANLLDYHYIFSNDIYSEGTTFRYYRLTVKPNTQFTLKSNAPSYYSASSPSQTTFLYGDSSSLTTADNGVYDSIPKTATSTAEGYLYIAVRKTVSIISQVTEADFINGTYYIMLVEGSTAPSDYIPYGYKIPILSNGVSYPIYLSEPIRKIGDTVDTVPSTGTATYNIKKLVITGEERWFESNGLFYFAPTNFENRSVVLCTHYPYYDGSGTSAPDKSVLTKYGGGVSIWIKDSSYATVTDFTTFLAQEYSNKTPVTVYYVAATPTTESFTAPSIPTSGTAQSFDVSTSLKPSEVSLTYHGWHDHTDTKYTSG